MRLEDFLAKTVGLALLVCCLSVIVLIIVEAWRAIL